ncbi:MAG: hypothetical protein VYB72_01570 [Planctomycetota bacterium]|nr:hypothetical protein [Planctomycetota bacterium]
MSRYPGANSEVMMPEQQCASVSLQRDFQSKRATAPLLQAGVIDPHIMNRQTSVFHKDSYLHRIPAGRSLGIGSLLG